MLIFYVLILRINVYNIILDDFQILDECYFFFLLKIIFFYWQIIIIHRSIISQNITLNLSNF